MEKIYYNKDGWVCDRYPYNLPIENDNRYIEVSDDIYENTLQCELGKSWRVVNGELKQDIYDNIVYQKEQVMREIASLKQELQYTKEDVEQITLFGMQRDDYEQKKARCVEIIERLRVLEKQI